MLFMVSAGSRILKDNPRRHRFSKSDKLLQELGFDEAKLKHYRRDGPDRRSPGGPDSQHH